MSTGVPQGSSSLLWLWRVNDEAEGLAGLRPEGLLGGDSNSPAAAVGALGVLGMLPEVPVGTSDKSSMSIPTSPGAADIPGLEGPVGRSAF